MAPSNAEGKDVVYRRLLGWMLQMAHLPSGPDILLFEDPERGPGGKVLDVSRSSRLHSMEVASTTDAAFADKVAVTR